MSASFYLFDVDQGQSAALKLPNGRWCVFDVGKRHDFSPMEWVRERMEIEQHGVYLLASLFGPRTGPLQTKQPTILKATISHLHGDHLADWPNLLNTNPEYFRTVVVDNEYFQDVIDSSSGDSKLEVIKFHKYYKNSYGPASSLPDYGEAIIDELSLPVNIARQLPGNANSRVNNASIVTRVTCHNTAILLCGDVETEAWDFALKYREWRQLVQKIDILIAPHHGHKSGFCTELLRIARPRVVLASLVQKNPNIDTRYSLSEFVSGIRMNNGEHRCITTRSKGHIRLEIGDNGERSWTFGDAALGTAKRATA